MPEDQIPADANNNGIPDTEDQAAAEQAAVHAEIERIADEEAVAAQQRIDELNRRLAELEPGIAGVTPGQGNAVVLQLSAFFAGVAAALGYAVYEQWRNDSSVPDAPPPGGTVAPAEQPNDNTSANTDPNIAWALALIADFINWMAYHAQNNQPATPDNNSSGDNSDPNANSGLSDDTSVPDDNPVENVGTPTEGEMPPVDPTPPADPTPPNDQNNDGIPDAEEESDIDGDGILDSVDKNPTVYDDPNSTENPLPNSTGPTMGDSDGDGVSDDQDYAPNDSNKSGWDQLTPDEQKKWYDDHTSQATGSADPDDPNDPNFPGDPQGTASQSVWRDGYDEIVANGGHYEEDPTNGYYDTIYRDAVYGTEDVCVQGEYTDEEGNYHGPVYETQNVLLSDAWSEQGAWHGNQIWVDDYTTIWHEGYWEIV